ncbi:hypothetical protein DFH27DRAFT_611027 [Peziza echinospora]|nr:hypothetical protein DFH27DRAFT_611027 [Peziza echinospora]
MELECTTFFRSPFGPQVTRDNYLPIEDGDIVLVPDFAQHWQPSVAVDPNTQEIGLVNVKSLRLKRDVHGRTVKTELLAHGVACKQYYTRSLSKKLAYRFGDIVFFVPGEQLDVDPEIAPLGPFVRMFNLRTRTEASLPFWDFRWFANSEIAAEGGDFTAQAEELARSGDVLVTAYLGDQLVTIGLPQLIAGVEMHYGFKVRTGEVGWFAGVRQYTAVETVARAGHLALFDLQLHLEAVGVNPHEQGAEDEEQGAAAQDDEFDHQPIIDVIDYHPPAPAQDGQQDDTPPWWHWREKWTESTTAS